MTDDPEEFYTDVIEEPPTGQDCRIGYALEPEDEDDEAGPVEPESDDDADADDDPDLDP